MIAVDKCIVCDSDKQLPFATLKEDKYYKRISMRTDYDVQYVICNDCGLVYQNPVLDESEMSELYSEKYRPKLDVNFFEKQATFFGEKLYSWITKRISLNGDKSVLDIGCGAGTMLIPFKENGWNACGIEPTKNISEFGREHFGVNITTGYYDKNAYPGKKFKLIVSSHVLEHVLYPEKVLHDIKNNMNEESYLFIGTPNITLPMVPYILGGDHVRLFSNRTLSIYLRKLGFDIVSMDNWVPRGIRAIVRKQNQSLKDNAPKAFDDYKAIKGLYKTVSLLKNKEGIEGFTQFSDRVIIRNNLLINKLCKYMENSGIRLVKNNGKPVNAIITSDDSNRKLLYRCKDPMSVAIDLVDKVDLRDHKIIIMFGYGLGYFPKILLNALGDGQRLIVYEDNIPLLKSAFLHLNLLGFLNDKRVIIAINREMLIKHLKDSIKETNTKDFFIMTNSMIDTDYLNRFKEIMDSL
ncbi:MAG: class I SAM-dependent methyltransferase [Nitrospirae bacterium]|nr:class I SAM-dependent methyltransferase [Nitrospirota bacterium]